LVRRRRVRGPPGAVVLRREGGEPQGFGNEAESAAAALAGDVFEEDRLASNVALEELHGLSPAPANRRTGRRPPLHAVVCSAIERHRPMRIAPIRSRPELLVGEPAALLTAPALNRRRSSRPEAAGAHHI
jgi:hypothetical protein